MYGNADSATKLAKAIDTIYPSQQQIENNQKKGTTLENTWNEAKRTFNSYSSGNETNSKITAADNNSEAIKSEIEKKHLDNLYKYYEYVQFKKATFKCTEVKYDDSATGRVKEMDFEFVSIS